MHQAQPRFIDVERKLSRNLALDLGDGRLFDRRNDCWQGLARHAANLTLQALPQRAAAREGFERNQRDIDRLGQLGGAMLDAGDRVREDATRRQTLQFAQAPAAGGGDADFDSMAKPAAAGGAEISLLVAGANGRIPSSSPKKPAASVNTPSLASAA